MLKYEKPELIPISKLAKAEGACTDGTGNIEICNPGGTVVPGCRHGTTPVIQGG